MALLLAILVIVFVTGAEAKEDNPVQIIPQDLAMAKSVHERQVLLEKKEQELAEREKMLSSLEKEVNDKLERNIALQKELKETLASLQVVRDKQFKNLIKVYSAMSASKVAPLLDEMDDNDAVVILKAMQADQVAKIIPKMEKEKAVRISRELGLL
jgi:flagellar motility protein MotE (MotC chaperone)